MALTAGLSEVCAARSGGIKNLWLSNKDDIAAAGFTLTGSNYSTVTMESAKVFYKFEFDQDQAEYRWEPTVENKSIKIDHFIEFYIGNMSAVIRDALQQILDASPCGMVSIAEANEGTLWTVGYSENHPSRNGETGRPLSTQTMPGGTGKVFTDPIGSNVILMNTNNELARPYTGTVPV